MTVADLRSRLRELTVRDENRLRRRLDRARTLRDPDRRAKALHEVADAVAAAEAHVAARARSVPLLSYPADLPVTGRRDEIADAIARHQVVIVAGETGSGKTTQLPKIALGLGRGVRGSIGHTQPRRIAARTVAERISEECGTRLGDAVGYTVRFHDETSEDTLVRVMTDGILLAEIHDDPLLRRYDTLIIDEAHERTLSIDFLLGYLNRILPRRPDLKVVITSATIDPERFAQLFGGAPVIEVSGRSYPVEIRYRPVAERDDEDSMQAISDAVDELVGEGPGDILVFLSGEREIRDTADMLRQRSLPRTEVLSLYGRLSASEQHRVFQPHAGRHVVLATNVAETSLTVPGIAYVIDAGTARISRYSRRLKVQRLPIEPISQASARQRSGRCGRTADGICIRLYSQEDFESRPEFTDPEILRTNLASVILQMAALGLGAVEDFGFMDPPDGRAVRDGRDLLHELGALRPDKRGAATLTRVGRDLARLPVDPRLGRMLLAAGHNGCLREVLVIVSGLAIQDPRERPADRQQAADAQHARFADPGSDFVAYLNLWQYLRRQRRALSGSQFRRTCREEFLHFLRVREWQDVHAQLRRTVRDLGLVVNDAPAETDHVHESLLAGLLSHVGLRDADGREFTGARQTRFAVFPGSSLARRPPRWVMAAELVETSRLWARTVASIDPSQVERVAEHLVRRSHSEPHWSKSRAAVMAYERVTLYGIPLASDRLVPYGRLDPTTARELFIRHALVQGEWETRHAFLSANERLVAEVGDLEERARRRDIRVDDETLFDFYDRRIGPEVVSGQHFDSWWKRTRPQHPHLLDLTLDDLIRDDAETVSEENYPTEWHSGDKALPLTYAFVPGEAHDGTTVEVPLTALLHVDDDQFAWHVPGRRLELVTALLRSLPKSRRRHLVPAQDLARRLVELPLDAGRPLREAVAEGLCRLTGIAVPVDEFDLERIPDHLRVTFRVTDGEKTVAVGKDLAALREELRPALRAAVAGAAPNLERDALTGWDFDALPHSVETVSHGHAVTGYPTLVDRGGHVDLRVVETEQQQRIAMRAGLRRLLMMAVRSPVAQVAGDLPTQSKLVLAGAPYPSVQDLLRDCFACAVDQSVDGETAWDRKEFDRLAERVREDGHRLTTEVAEETARALEALARLRVALDGASVAQRPVADDIGVQVSWLVYPGFVAETGLDQLRHLPRYLDAARRRLETVEGPRDLQAMADVQELEGRFYEAVQAMPEDEADRDDVRALRWSLEELRVSLFAQQLGTPYPVSVKRVRGWLERVERSPGAR